MRSGVLFLVTLLSACSLAKFDRFPGVRSNEIPDKFQGYYKQIVSEKLLDKEDSTGLRIGNIWWEIVKPSGTTRTYMGDSVILSQYKGQYFISVTNSYVKYWYVFVAEPDENGAITSRPIVANGRKFPLRKYLERLHVNDSAIIYKMNEEQLLKYYVKVVRKHPGIKIKKVSE
jgi:hypothetical protein